MWRLAFNFEPGLFFALATGLAIEPAETDAVRAAPLVESIKREIADTPFAASFVASEPVALVRKLAVS